MNTNLQTVEQTETNIVRAVDLKKPVRREFYRDVVLNAQGGVLDESVWKPIIGESKGRSAAGKLRKAGMQIVHVFDKPEYESAKRTYSSSVKQAKICERDFLIVGAFSKAGQPVEPHIERALKDLLPLFNSVSQSKATSAFKNVIKIVAHGSGLSKQNASEVVEQAPETQNQTAE